MKITINQVQYAKISDISKLGTTINKNKQINQVKFCIKLRNQLKKCNKLNRNANYSEIKLQRSQ